MNARRSNPLRVLLVGAGSFGRHHLTHWLAVQAAGAVVLAGVVVRTEASAAALRRSNPSLRVHVGMDQSVLVDVDVVDIATPTPMHAELAAMCLPHADVLCEKPLAATEAQARHLFRLARRKGRRLQVVQNYLHQPVVQALLRQVCDEPEPQQIAIRLTNPAVSERPSVCVFEEWVHVFYLLRALQGGPVKSVAAWQSGSQAEVSVGLGSTTKAQLVFGWQGAERQRIIEVRWPDHKIRAELDDDQLVTVGRGGSRRSSFDREPSSLRNQIQDFIARRGSPATLEEEHSVLAALKLMERARSNARSRLEPATLSVKAGKSRLDRPRVLVVGGGVFGATAAVELSGQNQVVLVERHNRLMTEASWLNQWRHHSGFHYPRSLETIEEIRDCKATFESVYESAIDRSVTAYYAVSASGREISRDRYLAVCDANRLNYKIVSAPANIVRPERLSVCLQTDEAVVRIDKISAQLLKSLRRSRSIDLHLATTACSGKLLPDGRKAISLRGPAGLQQQEFDFVVNATYAGTNAMARWFGFALRPMRFDLLELAVFSIPKAPRFMMTILDGPFTSLTHTGKGDQFMLSHIHQSVLASQVTESGQPPNWGPVQSNFEGLRTHGLRYLPILEGASFVESRIGVRTVEAHREDFDGRPTVVTPHGFGCWSVLGGKIITAVSNAREISRAISTESQG